MAYFKSTKLQDEAKLEALMKSLSKHGTLLFVVDQPATIGALPVAAAQAAGIPVAYLPARPRHAPHRRFAPRRGQNERVNRTTQAQPEQP